jgi:hypothetical protein
MQVRDQCTIHFDHPEQKYRTCDTDAMYTHDDGTPLAAARIVGAGPHP